MKVIICLVVLVVAVSARPQGLQETKVIPIVSMSHVTDDKGQFALSYLGGNGASETRSGALVLRRDGKDYVLVQKGSYSYINPQGRTLSVSYTADEDGFHAEGDHLPKDV